MKTKTEKPVGLALLREPFPEHQISKLPKPFKKDAQKGKCAECGGYHGLPAAHLDYVGHAALTDRLLDADEGWTWEPLATGPDGLPQFDESGGLWIRLTVCGVTRLGYGHAERKNYMDAGAREKEVIGDALRNAAMRFGAALDLWHKGQLRSDEDETPALVSLPEPIGYKDWLLMLSEYSAELDIDAFRLKCQQQPKKHWLYLTESQPDVLTTLVDRAKQNTPVPA